MPLTLLASRPRGVLWAWLHGVVVWCVAVPWIGPTLQTFGGIPRPGAWALLVLMAAYLGLYDAAFVFGLRRWIRLGSPALVVGAAAGWWILLELVRSVLIGGFPWNLAATAWIESSGALALSAWVGVAGVSALVVGVSVACALAIQRRTWEVAATVLLLAALAVIVADRWAGPAPEKTASLAVSLVQPNHRIVFDDAETLWRQYRELIEMSRAECQEYGPRLLIWPESAAWPHSWDTSRRLRDDVTSLANQGCPIVLNSSLEEGGRLTNSALLVQPDGLGGRYDKRRLVPWGEYVPGAALFPFIGRLARAAGNYDPGSDVGLLEVAGQRLGIAICYEVVFSGGVREQVEAGATVLATITNDAWYGPTSAPHQHFRGARFRAAENGRPLVRAALTGISGLVGPRGEVVASLGVGEKGILRGEVHGRTRKTLFTRVPWITRVLALLAVTSAIFRASRRTP